MTDTEWAAMATSHKRLHQNPLFYSLTAELAPAVVKAFRVIMESKGTIDSTGYYEFGLFKGYNLWFAERYVSAVHNVAMHFHGFDSFEGMPENTVHPHWAGGNWAVGKAEVEQNLRRYGAHLPRVSLHQGWFSQSWFDELARTVVFEPVSVAVIDCDLYESAVPVLGFLGPLLREGSVLLFDDWKAYDDDPKQGEQLAWAEFCAARPWMRYEPLFDFGIYGHALRVLA